MKRDGSDLTFSFLFPHTHICRVTLVWALFLGACQTIPKSNLNELPNYLQANFSHCYSEGALDVTLFSQDRFQMRNRIDFFSDSGQTEIEISGLFDEWLQSLIISDSNVAQKGVLTRQLEPLKVDKIGFLTWEDHMIAVKAEEIGCLLSFHLPATWLKNLRSLYQEEQVIHLYSEDEHRFVHTTFNDSGYCVAVTWYGFWLLFKRQLNWCVENKEKISLTLRGVNGYHMVFIPFETEE